MRMRKITVLVDGHMGDVPPVALSRRVLQRAAVCAGACGVRGWGGHKGTRRPPRDPRFQAPVGASRKGTGDSDAKVSPRI